jgi:hypothetical protein
VINIDMQRVAAVRKLEELGYSYRDGEWAMPTATAPQRTGRGGGGKDCLRSATALAAWRQQRPTANSETLTSPACCRTSRRLMLLSVVNEKLSRLQFCALQGPRT